MSRRIRTALLASVLAVLLGCAAGWGIAFAAGLLELPCAPWSTVNYTPRGWKAPCYLIGDAYIEEWEDFWNNTNWEYWESRLDHRCRNCKMHSGFEHSAVEESMKTLSGKIKLAAWSISK